MATYLDGQYFWVADSEGNALFRIDPNGGPPVKLSGPGETVNSVSWDGENLWLLDGLNLVQIDQSGNAQLIYTLEVELSGVSVQGKLAFGTGQSTNHLYRFYLD